MKYKEIEFKYTADDIPLPQFDEFCRGRKPVRAFITSGWDKFFDNEADKGAFARHRREEGKFNQLSFKRKTTDKNNFIRTEHNITLGLDVTDEQVSAILAEFKLHFNASIFKNCFIYTFSDYILCYYVVYDKDLKELGRFIEIEVAEDYPWRNEEAAWDRLNELESEMASLGISPQRRSKLSLYERYKDV